MSNKLKHTPGPWCIKEFNGGEIFVEAQKSDDMPYALDVCGDDYTGYGDVEQRNHNMRLIAAAPEMLDVLIRFAKDGFAHECFACSADYPASCAYTPDQCSYISIKTVIERATGMTIDEAIKAYEGQL